MTGKKKRSFRRSVYLALGKLGLYVLLLGIFVICWRTCYCRMVAGRFLSSASIALMGVYAVMLYAFGNIYHAYDTGITRVSEVAYSQTLANFIAVTLFYILTCVGSRRIPDPVWYLLMLAAQISVATCWALIANRIYFLHTPPMQTVVIYREASDIRKLDEIDRFQDNFRVVKEIRDPQCGIDALIEQIGHADCLFVAGIDASLRNGLAKYCVENGVEAYMIPHIGDVIMAGAQYMQIYSVPVMKVERSKPSITYLLAKRTFDILGSVLLLVGLSPLMLLIALLIYLGDRGPVFYRQVRLTKDGKRFRICKFRSMRVDAEKDGIARLAGDGDDRITPIGGILRSLRLDELPQLFNILKGDMSFVGPRPERPEIAKQYEQTMPAFRMRLQVKAGLTGMAQVYGRYNTEPYSKLEMDLIYINRMSVPEDLRLLIATVKVLFLRESTKGVREGQTTADHQPSQRRGTRRSPRRRT